MMSMKMNSENENEFPRASPQWIDLPLDVTADILQRLGALDMLQAEKVCTTWRRICSDPSMWRLLHIKDCVYFHQLILKLCRLVVNRSQGHLKHLSIEESYYDDLLNHIVDRSRDLKRLTLNGFYGSRKAVVEAANKLPHLEELCLIDVPKIEASDIVNIGNSCPVLKSFTFDPRRFPPLLAYYTSGNTYAVAIAKNMPNLRHLCLNSITIKNEGLEAILDGCPNLESIDFRVCPELDVGGALGKRCYEQIKHVKFPV